MNFLRLRIHFTSSTRRNKQRIAGINQLAANLAVGSIHHLQFTHHTMCVLVIPKVSNHMRSLLQLSIKTVNGMVQFTKNKTILLNILTQICKVTKTLFLTIYTIVTIHNNMIVGRACCENSLEDILLARGSAVSGLKQLERLS